MREEQSRRTHTREFKLECRRRVVTGQKRPAQNMSGAEPLRGRAAPLEARGYAARGEAAFTEKRRLSQVEASERKVAELERFCGKLAPENEILRKGLAR